MRICISWLGNGLSKLTQYHLEIQQPDYHPQRPIIVGEEGLDSPETVTLKYEEAVARANGDLRGESPPEGLLPMSQFGKTQPNPIHGTDYIRE